MKYIKLIFSHLITIIASTLSLFYVVACSSVHNSQDQTTNDRRVEVELNDNDPFKITRLSTLSYHLNRMLLFNGSAQQTFAQALNWSNSIKTILE